MDKANKPCYTDYVRHALRFYSRYLAITQFKNDVDRENWFACYNALNTYYIKERNILLYIYGEFDTISDNVYQMSQKYQIDQNVIWDMMKELERKVAIERGLCI